MADGLGCLVFGAGAIGTYIGGSLLLQNKVHGTSNRVVFVERPAVAEEVRQRGLRLEMDGVQVEFPQVEISGSLEEALALGPFDVSLFALKSFDTAGAAEAMRDYADRLPPFLCLQNGVENETALAQVFGAQKVIPATVTSAVGRRAAGDVVLEKRRGIGVADGHPLSERIASTFTQAGLRARLYPRAQDMKWSKMLTNLLANASSAILDMTPVEIFSDGRAYQIEAAQQREALRVMAALGVKVVDLPGTPVRLLAWGMGRLPVEVSRPLVKQFAGKGRGEKMPSFHIDLHAGRGQSEVDYLNGAVVRFGAQTGVPTPVNRVLTQVLMEMTTGKTRLDEFAKQPDKLLALAKG